MKKSKIKSGKKEELIWNGSLYELVSLKKSEKILVLRGGISEEKEISVLTANQVYKTLQKKIWHNINWCW